MTHLKTAQIMARFVRAFNFPVKMDESGGSVQARLPGFGYDDLDRAGNVPVWRLFRYLEQDRCIYMNRGQFLSQHQDNCKFSLVMVLSQSMDISRSFYTNVRFDFPLLMNFSLNHVGKSSFSTHMGLSDDKTGEQYVSLLRGFAHVDLKLRKSLPLPDGFVKRYSDYLEVPRPSPITEMIVPQKVFRHRILVPHSDTDQYFHTNQAMYVKYCCDCAAEAALSGFYKNFKKDVCFYHAKKCSVLYKGESFAGDELEVVTWEQDDTLYFQIQKAEKIIFYGFIEFYPDTEV